MYPKRPKDPFFFQIYTPKKILEEASSNQIALHKYPNSSNLAYFGVFCVLRIRFLSTRQLHPLLEEKDRKSDSPKNYSFWSFAAHITQTPPKNHNFTPFAAFCQLLFIKINYYFV